MPRGRGILEVRKSDNPFYETTSSSIGLNININELQDTKAMSTKLMNDPVSHPAGNPQFSFLYTRTSDIYGVDPLKIDSSFNYDTSAFKQTFENEHNNKSKHTSNAKAALQLLKHEPIKQNPLYATSASEIGKKPPTEATFVAERLHRSQAFSKSFQHMKPKSSSLNTGLTKSTIHPSLDPQFI
jgi:hypothetical protein